MKKVVILQEYIPQYRVPFFKILYEAGKSVGIDISVAYGEAGTAQASRNDARDLDCGLAIRQREWRIAGRRVVVRHVADAIAGADMIILEQARRNLDAYKLLMAKPRNGPLVALWGHGKDYTRDSTALERKLSQWLTSKADWFFAYTNGGMETVVGDGFAPNCLTVVQNSIDTASLKSSVTAVDAHAIEDYSRLLDLRGKTALFIGALDPTKRLTFLEQAGRIAHGLDSNFRLLIAGEGVLRPQVESWARRHTWLKYLGSITGQEKAIAMASCEILTVPGRVGLVAVDSFASGRPIVTTDWPWHAPEFEYLRHGENAVVTRNNAPVYARGMIDVMDDRDLMKRLQTAASEDAEKFTIQAMADNFLDGIRRALMQRNS